LSKGSDPRSYRPGGRGKSRAKRITSRPGQGPPPAPNLAWAKWIDALGTDEPDLPESPEQAEQRLRTATEAAERARLLREATSATAEDATPPAQKSGPAGRVRVPKRHAPETDPADWRLHAPSATRMPRAARSASRAAIEPAVPAPAAPASASPLPVIPAPLPPASQPPLGDLLRDEPLPDRYHDDRITLIARDPYWLYAYWELTPMNWARARGILGEIATQLTLRVHDYPPHQGGQERGWMDIEVSAEARDWYLHGGRPGHAFEVEIGLRAEDGRFVPLARSNRVTTPLDRMSDVLDEQWLSKPADYERMYALSGGLATMGSASAEMPELLTRRMAEMAGSAAVSSFSHALPSPSAERGFWFELRAELIVYGAAAPGATVTCQGRPVPLRPDGTFTLRFALPDGAQEIACQAIAADHLDSITITPAVTKTTTRAERSHRSLAE